MYKEFYIQIYQREAIQEHINTKTKQY